MKNILVAIEGIDGSGKGTQTARLVSSLNELGIKAASLSFPRYKETAFGGLVSNYLNGRYPDTNPELIAALYAGDRFESKDHLIKLLNEHDVLVLDRYVGSSMAYQMQRWLEGIDYGEFNNEDPRDHWIEFCGDMEFVKMRLPKPRLTILIDMPVHISTELVMKKGKRTYTDLKKDIHESDLSYLDGVRQCYLHIAKSQSNWKIINGVGELGCRSIEDISSDILNAVTRIASQGVLF